MQVNKRHIRKCCDIDPLLYVDTLRSSYAIYCEKCKQKAVGLTIIGTVESWNNKDVLEDT